MPELVSLVPRLDRVARHQSFLCRHETEDSLGVFSFAFPSQRGNTHLLKTLPACGRQAQAGEPSEAWGGARAARPFEIFSEISKRCTAPVRSSKNPAGFYVCFQKMSVAERPIFPETRSSCFRSVQRVHTAPYPSIFPSLRTRSQDASRHNS